MLFRSLIANEVWPTYDEDKLVKNEITIAVQINGKLRDTLSVPLSISKEELESSALASETIKRHLEGKTIVRVIVVPGKIVNIVVK